MKALSTVVVIIAVIIGAMALHLACKAAPQKPLPTSRASTEPQDGRLKLPYIYNSVGATPDNKLVELLSGLDAMIDVRGSSLENHGNVESMSATYLIETGNVQGTDIVVETTDKERWMHELCTLGPMRTKKYEGDPYACHITLAEGAGFDVSLIQDSVHATMYASETAAPISKMFHGIPVRCLTKPSELITCLVQSGKDFEVVFGTRGHLTLCVLAEIKTEGHFTFNHGKVDSVDLELPVNAISDDTRNAIIRELVGQKSSEKDIVRKTVTGGGCIKRNGAGNVEVEWSTHSDGSFGIRFTSR